MANNDYWAYLREQRELRNDELMHYRVGGERSGYTKYPDKYKPVGDKAQSMLGSVGKYIGNASKNIKNAVGGARNAVSSAGTFLGNTAKSVGNKIGKGIHNARTIIRNNIAEGKRTSYGDMKNTVRNWQNENTYTEVRRGPRGGYGSGFSPDNGYANRTVYDQIEKGFLTGPAKGESFKSYKERAIRAVRAFKVDAVKGNDNFDEEKVFNGLMDYMDKKTNGQISALKKANENAEREARNKADPTYNDSARPQDAMKEKQEKSRKQVADTAKKLSALTMGHEDGWDSPSNPRAMFGVSDLGQLAIIANMDKKYRDGKTIDTLHSERYKRMVEFVKVVQSSPAVRREFAKLYDSPLSKGYGEDMIRMAMQINLDKL